MSRIGKKPVPIPPGVEVKVSGGVVTVKGPRGQLEQVVVGGTQVEISSDPAEVRVTRKSDKKRDRAFHGLMRALVANMVTGVSEGFTKRLEIQGIGYRAAMQGAKLVLQLGFTNPVEIDVPEGLEVEVPSNTRMNVKGCDKQAVGQFAAVIRSKRPPEPYKGKGIRYVGEKVRRLAGKSFAAVE